MDLLFRKIGPEEGDDARCRTLCQPSLPCVSSLSMLRYHALQARKLRQWVYGPQSSEPIASSPKTLPDGMLSTPNQMGRPVSLRSKFDQKIYVSLPVNPIQSQQIQAIVPSLLVGELKRGKRYQFYPKKRCFHLCNLNGGYGLFEQMIWCRIMHLGTQ